MDFYKLMKSLDALIYEVLTWLLLYPMTLYWMLRHPVRTMAAAERDVTADPEHQFVDMLGPPLFLAITIGLIHLVELSTHNVMPDDMTGALADFLADDTNNIAFNILMFALLPMITAIVALRRRKAAVTSRTLRGPVYAHCYSAAVVAIIFSASSLVGNVTMPAGDTIASALLVIGALWWGWVTARWFHREEELARMKALGATATALFLWGVAVLVVLILLVIATV